MLTQGLRGYGQALPYTAFRNSSARLARRKLDERKPPIDAVRGRYRWAPTFYRVQLLSEYCAIHPRRRLVESRPSAWRSIRGKP
jgi:hypothetical protein